jgi:hypothetical protein
MKTRVALTSLLALLLALSVTVSAAGPEVTVYKVATCTCCNKWAEHLRKNGFQVTVHEVGDTARYQREYGVPNALRSCHTALVAGYTMEGHVPAAEILRLLKERPSAKGLAVPGMPLGSPGMEGSRKDAYDVVLFQSDGRTAVYQHYPGN